MSIFKRFSFLIILRTLLLLANLTVLALIFGDKRLFFNQIILVTLLVIQVWELIRFVTRTNRDLARFFYAIRHKDFSMTFKQSPLGKSFRELEESMTDIMQAYKQVKIEKEAQFHFLQMLVNQFHIGIIVLENETVTLINPIAEKTIGISGLRNWKILETKNPAFATEVAQLGANGKKLVEIKVDFESRFLSVDTRTLLILEKPLKLITFQDINSEIEQKEIEAWHKLIRILTHEIMNSVTPISSLTETMQSLLTDKSGNQKNIGVISNDTIGDIRFSLNTIQKRSDGLLHFVENYRKLTRVPKPHVEKTNIRNFLQCVEKLMSKELAAKQIQLTISAKEDIHVHLDPTLIEQILINLLTNSIHALENTAHPGINFHFFYDDHHPVIEITDNGKGISAKELNEIFIPFFSTKKEGSGIGLSLSKQIMSLHDGSIKVKSEINKGTSFFLRFPQQKSSTE